MLFNIIDKLDYEINELGIKYKKFDDETFASHSIYLDICDITFYKRVLDRLNKKLGW